MANSLSLEERISVSTLFMLCNGETLFEALDAACDAGFESVEIVPSNFEGSNGYPRTLLCVGFNLDEITPAERDQLAQSVSRFKLRNVHSLHRGLNIASGNPGIVRESVRQFMQCAQLAVDINARSVTFHLGIPERDHAIGDESRVIQKDIEFGKQVAEFAEKHDLLCGYENLGSFPTWQQMAEIIDGIGSPRFGLHLDVGHAWLVGDTDPKVWVRELGERIVAMHMHATYHRPDRGYENHQSLDLDDCTDFAGIMAGLAAVGYDGPITFEFLSRNIPEYLEKCRQSKTILLEQAAPR